MKTKLTNFLSGIAFYLLLPVIGIAYTFETIYKNLKRKQHHKQLRKQGRATLRNPYADQWN